MVFSSHVFLFYFLPVALALCLFGPVRLRNLLLSLLSYVFYGWANPAFVFLMLGTTVVSYLAGRRIGRSASPSRRRVWLLVGLGASLGALGFFKYFNFGIDTWNAWAATLGLGGLHLELLFRVVLPLGLSFYTFQAVSYVVDVYRREAEPIGSFVDYATYLAMFPQLVAGPIVRYGTIRHQLTHREVNPGRFARGVAFLVLGLAKKVLIANPCGQVADAAFGGGTPGTLDAWIGLFAYSFQIYFDFSGYSDMAIGLGLMLGFVFPKNFDSPYKAVSITDFWRRWHISLSSWLRDYLYIPLGGNRKGRARTYANLLVVMLLGGLWHGASWNFVAWGGWHGILLAGERLLGKRSPLQRAPAPVRIAFTFVLVSLGWVWFRSPDFASAGAYFASLFGLGGALAPAAIATEIRVPFLLAMLTLGAVLAFLAPQAWNLTRRIPAWKAGCLVVLFALTAVVLSVQAFNPFIYFIF